ncbi:autolysin (n-acetylmuramoyl-l-alanine amidase) [Colletotrichum kahawae]|uniref:Autolysin (N-acetylmuramoyl-l-alanine amidase) n=1 Tax=Colletotrichum kahawae TaxID=34407 RepID=A0AAD9YGQ2_COLKA|nr:autolysin (n-acetylmuramoyl-l-alanine amidase) [Colletotrichum kahawae]
MRSDILLVLAAPFGSTLGLRRGCKHTTASEGWYYTTSIDSLDAIAADFCTSPAVIKQWNNIQSIKPGMNLKVPCHWNAGRQRDCGKNTATDGAYVIQSDDTLNSIAYDFCTTADKLQQMNSARITNKDLIYPDWVIQVPCSWN